MKRSVLGVHVDETDYEAAVGRVLEAALERKRLTVSALAVHGVMTGVVDQEHRMRLNRLDIVTPDGQPVRWAMRLLYGAVLPDRVYGPTLMLRVCERLAAEGLPVYLYGSREEVISRLAQRLCERFPGLVVAGRQPSRFRTITPDEKKEIIASIKSSGARAVFVGLGCPRQEVFAYEFGDHLSMPVLAVGAAFDYHAGLLREPPLWVQRNGLQWLFRLLQEPGRLWKRYLLTNTQFLALLALQALNLWRPVPQPSDIKVQEIGYG